MKSRDKIMALFAAALLVVGVFTTQATAEDNEIRLGVISPASGNYADLGAAERRGITMAVEEINAAGGVLGKQIKMIVEDTEDQSCCRRAESAETHRTRQSAFHARCGVLIRGNCHQ